MKLCSEWKAEVPRVFHYSPVRRFEEVLAMWWRWMGEDGGDGWQWVEISGSGWWVIDRTWLGSPESPSSPPEPPGWAMAAALPEFVAAVNVPFPCKGTTTRPNIFLGSVLGFRLTKESVCLEVTVCWITGLYDFVSSSECYIVAKFINLNFVILISLNFILMT